MRSPLSVGFIRLLFKNSEEVKRTRFSQTGFVWVVIALNERCGFVCCGAYQALPMIPGYHQHRAERCSGL
jgi:hypothetical protein